MSWVKKCKLPAIEAIQYNGQSCIKLNDLWQVLEIQRLDSILFASLFSSFFFLLVYSIFRTRIRSQGKVTGHTET